MHRAHYLWTRALRVATRQTVVSRFSTAAPVKPRSYTGLWTTTAGFVATTGYLLWHNTSPVYAEASSYAGTVEEPNTKLAFPIYLKTDSEWKRLIGLGVRQVSFLNINVYVLGLYMRSQDINNLKTMEGWERFDKSAFLEREDLAMSLLNQPVDVSIRIVPVRATNTQHLRDGFTRFLLQRMRDQSEHMSEEEEREIMKAIQEFKSNFPAAKVKKDTEFVFTKTCDGGLKIEFEGKSMGIVKNSWLATNFIMGYLNPKAPASELARQNIADGFEKLLNTAN